MDRSSFPNQQGDSRGDGNPGRVPGSALVVETKEDNLNWSLVAALRQGQASRQRSHSQGSGQNLEIYRLPPLQNMGMVQGSAYAGNLTASSFQNSLRMFAPTLSSSNTNSASIPPRASPPSSTADLLLRVQLQSNLLANQQTRSLLFPANPEPALRDDNWLQRMMLVQQLGGTLPGTDSSVGLSLDQILLLLRQPQQVQGLQQVAVGLSEQQLHYNNAGSVESLASRLLSSGATPSSSSLFTASPSQLLLQSEAHPVDHALRFPASSFLGDLSVTAASSQSSTTNSGSNPSRVKETAPHSSPEPRSSHDKKNVKKAARRKRNDSDTTGESGLAAITGESPSKRKKRAYHHESFPIKLYRLLRESEEAGKTDIISFTEDGKQFCVHKPTEFEAEILPHYFRHNQLSSFRRLLNMYGFARLQEGAEGGTFRHPSFIKGKPELCKDLDRVR